MLSWHCGGCSPRNCQHLWAWWVLRKSSLQPASWGQVWAAGPGDVGLLPGRPLGFGSGDSREQHNPPPCGLRAASGTNSSPKARGLHGGGGPYGARGSCESLGRAWKELERAGRKGAGWLSNFSPGHFLPLPSVPTKALLRNVGHRKAPFETPEFWRQDADPSRI